MTIFTSNAFNWLCLILQERFGHKFTLSYQNKALRLSLAGQTRNYILFPRLIESFFQSRSDIPCCLWDAKKEGWHSVLDLPISSPGVDILPEPLIIENLGNFEIHYDILGLIYWVLNRIEEIGRTDLDCHDRFPAVNSHAYKNNYLERPIVDEWLYILSQVIKRIWPQLKLKEHYFNIKVSHDVDRPSYYFTPWLSLCRIMLVNLVKYRNLKTLIHAPYLKLTGYKQFNFSDPYNTFDYLMDISEKNNLQSAFYFICGRTHAKTDAMYNPEYSVIRNLMRRINNRGHKIGLHPSYGTYQRPAMIQGEARRLKKICAEENIEQPFWGGRMHYLRWEHPTTLQAWNDAGMDYDSTLGYADQSGFRCGTCFEYPAFNPLNQRLLAIRIRPLIVMDDTIIGYLGLGTDEAALNKI